MSKLCVKNFQKSFLSIRQIIFLLLILIGLFSVNVVWAQANLAQVGTGKRVALIIGNSEYKNTSRLTNPVNDAEDISTALKGFGFEVIILKNGTRRQMTEKLSEFSQKIENAGAALVYYAGHGAQIRGANYLLPIDANTDTEAAIMDESISLNRVLDELEGGRGRVNIVMLDACRNNPITGKFRSATRGLAAPTAQPKGTVVVYATDPGNTAEDGGGRNGTFTSGLLKAFKGKDLSLDGVLTTASEEVERASGNKQTPYVNGPKPIQKQFFFAGNITVNPGSAQVESEFWSSIKSSTDVADFEAYLKQFPQGTFKVLAENAIRRLRTNTNTNTANSNNNGQTNYNIASSNTTSNNTVASNYTNNIGGKRYSPGQVFQDCKYCPSMVAIAPGSYLRGSPSTEANRKESEGPVQKVSILYPIAVGQKEISVEEFSYFVNATGYKTEATVDGYGCSVWNGNKYEYKSEFNWQKPNFPQGTRHPVVCVSWNDANAYVSWLSKESGGERYRLLTEAEWEYAARAGTQTRYFWGDGKDNSITCQYANSFDTTAIKTIPGLGQYTGAFCNDGYAYTSPVASYRPNQFGLYDMHGNVAEWVQDIWHENYVGSPTNGRAWLEGGDTQRHVQRDGPWGNAPNDMRAAYRLGGFTTGRSETIGFRVARNL